MIFRQLFEPESSSYTYLLGCPDTRAALLIDPVLETVDRDLGTLRTLGLEPTFRAAIPPPSTARSTTRSSP